MDTKKVMEEYFKEAERYHDIRKNPKKHKKADIVWAMNYANDCLERGIESWNNLIFDMAKKAEVRYEGQTSDELLDLLVGKGT